MTVPIRALIADDHPFFRRVLREYLEQHRGMVVVGLAGNGEDAVAFARDLAPDLVLIKAGLPGQNGGGDMRVAERIKAARPHGAVILYAAGPDALPGHLAHGVDLCLNQDRIFEALADVPAGIVKRAPSEHLGHSSETSCLDQQDALIVNHGTHGKTRKILEQEQDALSGARDPVFSVPFRAFRG
jgi:CheY-like chemotaxis protein